LQSLLIFILGSVVLYKYASNRVSTGQRKLEKVGICVVRERSGKNIIFEKSGKMILDRANCGYL